jgi:putative transposase
LKEWLTARELAAEGLPDMPRTESAVIRRARREGWSEHPSFARDRSARGGGLEYNYRLLPPLAQIAYVQRYLKVDATEVAPAQQTSCEPPAISARASRERDARLAIVSAYARFTRGLKLGHATHVQVFTAKYNAGTIDVDAWVRDLVPMLSKRSLIRWRSAKRDGKVEKLARDPGAARKGTGVIETANGGALKTFVLGLIAHQPFLAADRVRTLCLDEFGATVNVVSKGVEAAIPMPPVRTFQHALKALKQAHRVELIRLTNPDLYRSTLAPAGVGTLRDTTSPNALWQIDASPMDSLCTDGRHSIYLCLDIATRREVILLSRTPRASAVALLMRKAILAWGVPDVVKTDNGSDFTARDTKRLLAALGIEIELSAAYSPQQKGHVERAIRTFQHEVGPLLPGFVGHSVADRKAIESRKSFAQRLGADDADTFGVSLTASDLQRHIDEWLDKVQQHKPHSGLKGRTPAVTAMQSTTAVRRVDERALDLLLMPVAGGDGRRRTTKFGVRVDGRQ